MQCMLKDSSKNKESKDLYFMLVFLTQPDIQLEYVTFWQYWHPAIYISYQILMTKIPNVQDGNAYQKLPLEQDI